MGDYSTPITRVKLGRSGRKNVGCDIGKWVKTALIAGFRRLSALIRLTLIKRHRMCNVMKQHASEVTDLSLVLPEDPCDIRSKPAPRRSSTGKPEYRQIPALAKMKGIDIWRILTTDMTPSGREDKSSSKLHLVTSQWVDHPRTKK